ncbi:DUF1697 domain-containing protein [Nakamurella antarctica]|nr:DUF1697 domain-containing protein [Nakamurella antarctica]
MTTYVALLRAVNVGGAKVSMTALREIALRQGWTNVSTYINSGNLLFDSLDGPIRAADLVSSGIEAAIDRHVAVVVRTPDQLAATLERSRELFAHDDDKHVAIAFLDRPVQPASLGQYDLERYVVDGAQVHLLYPTGLGNSKLTTPLIEKKLDAVATTRGRKTVMALVARASKQA